MIQRILAVCFLSCLLNQNYSFSADDYELHEAAKSLNIKSLATLLTRTILPEEVNRENKEGKLPLVLVLTQENVDIEDQLTAASLLIKYGANVNLPQTDGTYPLHAVCEYANDVRLLTLLLENKAAVNVSDSSGQTPLHNVSIVGNEIYLERLLERKADVHSRDSIGRRTPILAAANTPRNQYGVIKKLLEGGANPNDEDKYGSVLHNIAERNRDPKVAELLSLHGADLERKGKGGLYAGKTPLEVARDAEMQVTLQRLIKEGKEGKNQVAQKPITGDKSKKKKKKKK